MYYFCFSCRESQVDATIHKAIGTRFAVKGYPTLKFFVDGEPKDFNGGRTAPEIVAWMKKKTGDACTVAAAKEDVEAEVATSHFALLGAFKVLLTSISMKKDFNTNC